MPLHSWLPRAHPVAPAHLSALMSGVMIKVALYGLIRVLFEWAAPAPEWSGLLVLGIGLLSALGGVLYALFQHDLKRLLAFHSIENVGIVALGLGASILFASDGEATWAAIAFAAALLHILNHAIFKALLFLGAGAFERAVGALELDRLGGLLRRMPWTGGAFLVGADGDRRRAAAERVCLGVADAAVAGSPGDRAAGSASASPAPWRRPASPRPRPSPSTASSRWSGWCCWARRGARRSLAATEAAAEHAGGDDRPGGALRRCSASSPDCSCRRWPSSPRSPSSCPRRRASTFRGRARCRHRGWRSV